MDDGGYLHIVDHLKDMILCWVIDSQWLIVERIHDSARTGKQSGLCCCVTLSGTGWPWSYRSLLDRSLGPTASLNAQLWLGVIFHEE